MARIESQIDSRADYIRKLTENLSLAGKSAPISRDVGSIGDSVDDPTVADSSTLLYKFGQDVSVAGSSIDSPLFPRSVASRGPSPGLRGGSGGKLLTAFPALGNSNSRQGSASAMPPLGGSIRDSFDSTDLKSESIERDLGSIADNDHISVFSSSKELGKSRPTKLVSGSQFRLITKHGARHCDQCEVQARVNKKHTETIRTLKLQLARLEERCHDLKRTKASDVAHQIAIKSSLELAQSDNEDLDFFSKKCSALEEELAKMKKMLSFERHANEGLRSALDDTKSSLKKEVSDLQNENGRLMLELQACKTENVDAKKRVDEVNNSLVQYKQQLEKTEVKLSDALLRLSAQKTNNTDIEQLRELQRLKAHSHEQEEALRKAQQALRQKETELLHTIERMQVVQLSVTSVEEQRDTLQTQLNRCQAELRGAQEMLQSTKKRCDVLEGTVKSTVEQRVSVTRQLNDTQNELRTAKHRSKEQEQEIAALNHRVTDLLRRIAVDGENMRQAVEKAVSASVRLCVVAPTVNVQVAESKRMRFKSDVSREQLNQFLQTEVLAKYSFLFKQKTDSAAPDGGSLEDWLQSMLGQMQRSIEHHVNSAMDGSSM